MKTVREYDSEGDNGPAVQSPLQKATAVRAGRVRFLVLLTMAVATWTGMTSQSVLAGLKDAPRDTKPAKEPAGSVENGRRLFTEYGCYECHNRDAQGATGTGPRLGPNPDPLSVIILYVRNPTGEMPPYTEKVVSDQDLADIHAFLESLQRPPDAKSIPLLKDASR